MSGPGRPARRRTPSSAGGSPTLGDRQTEAAARKVAYRLDPHGFVARTRGAHQDRRVTLRPAPDTMSRLTGFLPVAQGVAAKAALGREADRLRAAGDPRSRGQIMADTLVERVTGQAVAAGVPVEVHLVMTDATLLARRRRARRPGRRRPDPRAGRPRPDPRHRDADGLAAPALHPPRRRDAGRDGLPAPRVPRTAAPAALVRDQYCRTSWCGAPVRHADHVTAWADGGATSEANGQGLCEACNYAKQAPGWHARPGPDGAGDLVETTTPTGHTYTSRPPPLPGPRRPPIPTHPDRRWLDEHDRSLVEERLRRLLAAA